MAPFDISHTSSYSSFIVTMAISCIVFEMKQDIGLKRRFFITTRSVDNFVVVFCVVQADAAIAADSLPEKLVPLL